MLYIFAALSPRIFFFWHCRERCVLRHVLRNLEVNEAFDEPSRCPERVVTGELDPVLTDPVDEFADDLGEIAWPGVHERHRYGQPSMDIGFLGGDPAKIFEPGQTHVLHHEIEVGEVRRCVIDIRDVESVPVQGPDGGALMDVDVLDAELAAFLEVAVGPWIGQFVAA
jgi:hypothetical protein